MCREYRYNPVIHSAIVFYSFNAHIVLYSDIVHSLWPYLLARCHFHSPFIGTNLWLSLFNLTPIYWLFISTNLQRYSHFLQTEFFFTTLHLFYSHFISTYMLPSDLTELTPFWCNCISVTFRGTYFMSS